MSLSQQLANQFREVYLNGKWVALTNLKEQLSDVTWEQANQKIGELNTLAQLTYHLNYYVAGLNRGFINGALDISDKYSFDMPPVSSQAEWEQFLEKCWSDAEQFANHIEKMSDEEVMGPFIEEKYGTNFRNIQGMIEHCYYHFGQIVLIKKMVLAKTA